MLSRYDPDINFFIVCFCIDGRKYGAHWFMGISYR